MVLSSVPSCKADLVFDVFVEHVSIVLQFPGKCKCIPKTVTHSIHAFRIWNQTPTPWSPQSPERFSNRLCIPQRADSPLSCGSLRLSLCHTSIKQDKASRHVSAYISPCPNTAAVSPNPKPSQCYPVQHSTYSPQPPSTRRALLRRGCR